MRETQGVTVGFAITGSFCTFEKIKKIIKQLVDQNMRVIPIFSEHTQQIDNRFCKAKEFIEEIQRLTGEKGIYTIPEAETIGPKGFLDAYVIAPCTGNSMAKLAAGITDTPVLMGAKAHLRNEKPLIISISTNDALSMNLKNIGLLMNMKNIYFVPFGQDDFQKKPNSMISHVELIPDTIVMALKGKQLQPVILAPNTIEM